MSNYPNRPIFWEPVINKRLLPLKEYKPNNPTWVNLSYWTGWPTPYAKRKHFEYKERGINLYRVLTEPNPEWRAFFAKGRCKPARRVSVLKPKTVYVDDFEDLDAPPNNF